MVGHGGILAFDDQTSMRDVARHLLRFGAHESCGKCFPCRIGLHRAHDMFVAEAPVPRERLEELLDHKDPTVRYRAVNALAELGGSKPALEKRKKIEKDADVKGALTKALKGK